MFSKLLSIRRSFFKTEQLTDIQSPKKSKLLFFIPALALSVLISDKLFQAHRTEGNSMTPTIGHAWVICVDKFLFKFTKRGLKKGDIVISKCPSDPDNDICKRIVYTPGEATEYSGIKKIPTNHYWIEGDNKENSFDSRMFGSVPKSFIKGRVLFSIYPFRIFKNTQ